LSGLPEVKMDISKKFNFKEIVNNFTFDGEFVDAVSYGFGHINDTFVANFKKIDGRKHRYIIQRINHNVFKNPEKLMKNIQGVTLHLKYKILEAGGDPSREALSLILTKNGLSFHKDKSGNFWRAYIFIENAKTYQLVENMSHFYNAGKAFGKFQKLLSDYPVDTLYETIPDFHNTQKRYEAFSEALKKDIMNRGSKIMPEIDFIEKRAEDVSVLVNLLKQGKLPLKVTHNDTKFNNVMIDDKTGEGVCVIDLDTVMPGLSIYDFGDSIRSGTNTGEEDERDLSKVRMDINLFDQYTRGFLEAAADSLTLTEIEYLPFASKLITFECGIRFLTDYLNGDTYFKIRREDQNLDRCRTQFKLVSDMEDKFDRMIEIVKKYC